MIHIHLKLHIRLMTKVKQEKSLIIPWISSKCRENFYGFCFICLESAGESHCSKDSLGKLLQLIKICKNREAFLIYM